MKLKLIISSLFSGIVFLLVVSVVTAQTPSSQTQFPFTINGKDCNTKAECRVLCQDPVNVAACKALNPNPTPRIDRFSDPAFVQATNAALGCSTAQTCKAVCSLKVNFDKCHQFAQEQQVEGGYDKRVLALSSEDEGTEVEDPDLELLKEAEAQLVSSEQTLSEFCDEESNQKVCSILARKLGLRGGLRLEGPGGCQSADTCRAYCDDPAHFSECKQFEIAGLNNCTSELACYNELQSHPETLRTHTTESEEENDQDSPLSAEDLAQLERTCSSVVTQYQGKTASELAGDISQSGSCQVLPKSGVPGKNSNCDAYLSSDQPFSQEVFEKICEMTPVVSSQRLQKVDTKSSANLDSYEEWCKALPSVGQSSGDWQVIPTLCQNFVSTYQKAREACGLSEANRPTWLQDPVAYSRYCLSAPSDKSDYAASCAASSAACLQGGFDWYCQQEGKTCVPLYQGRPIDQSVETFASAGLIKDGEKVSLVLDENTLEFAEGALADTIEQTGASSQFEVVSELPQTISREAVFVAGTGVNQRRGQNQPRNFQQTIFDKPSLSQDTNPTTSTFAQPWFLLDARQPTNMSPMPTRAIDNTQPATGWNVVKQGEKEFKQKIIEEKQNLEKNIKREVQGILIPVSNEFKIDPILFKPQPTGSIKPIELKPTISSGSQEKIEPTKFVSKSPTNSPNTTYKSPTPYSNTSGSGSGTSGSGSEPTRPPAYVPPTEPPKPTSFSPTSPPTTTTNSGTGSTSGSSGSSGTSGSSGSNSGSISPTPEVKGVETEESLIGVIWQNILNIFH